MRQGSRLPRWGAVLGLAAAAALAACGEAGKPYDFRVQDDKFRPYQNVLGQPISRKVAEPTGEVTTLTLTLEARRDRGSGALSTHANVSVGYRRQGMRRYDAARNARAEALPFRHQNHAASECIQGSGCYHEEWLIIDVAEPDLRAAHATGYEFKIFSKSGFEAALQVSPGLLEAFLKAYDDLAAGRPVATRS